MSLVAEKAIENYVRTAGTPFIPLPDACKFLGISPKSGRSMVTRERFPVPTTLRGRNRVVLADVLVAYYRAKLAEATGTPTPNATTSSKTEASPAVRKPGRPGRPTKAAEKRRKAHQELQSRIAEQIQASVQ